MVFPRVVLDDKNELLVAYIYPNLGMLIFSQEDFYYYNETYSNTKLKKEFKTYLKKYKMIDLGEL